MRNAFGVEVVHSIQDLLEKLCGLFLRQRLLLSQEVKEFPSRHQFKDQDHIRLVLKDVVEGDDVAVLDLSEDVHLSLDLLSAHAPSAGRQPSLLDKLGSVFCSRALFFTFAHDGKLSTARQENRNQAEDN